MPCIQTMTNVMLTQQREAAIKTKLGKAIALIPGKSERWLMLTFQHGCSVYFQGDNSIPAAFVEVKIFGSASEEVYEKMTEEITSIFHVELGIDPSRIYIKYEETRHWGWNGSNL